MDIQLNTLTHIKTELLDLSLRFGPKLLVAILILVAGIMVARWLGRATDQALHRLQLEPPVRQLLVRLERALVFALFAIIALQNLGVELLPLIAGLSVAGAGLALATQGVLSNVVAGLTIIFTKPYRVGDYVEIIGVSGQVQTITVFATTLLHGDLSEVVVPNRKVVGEVLHNYHRIRQTQVLVGVAYEADLAQALTLMRDLTLAHALVLRDPAPVVQVTGLADSAVQIAVKPWVAGGNEGTVAGDLSLAIVDACRRHGISIPFPQREVRMLGAVSPG